jgi:histidinol-phosphate/aromatic aminotransferase/cobyric acid decarboxylase-like protein
MDLDSLRSRHGGYWRYPPIDFHYLFNQYFPPPALVAELQAALPKLANSYPSGQHVLADLMARWKEEDYFTAENLVVGNGSSELIRLLNDRVLTKTTVPLPTFNEFIRRPAETLHCYALDEHDGFRLDVDRLLREVRRSGSESVVVVNPNNPVGNLVAVDDLRRTLESGVTLVVDEAFMAFTDGAHSAEPLVAEYDNLIVVTSCTKSMGIAGLRLGYVITRNEQVKAILRRALPIWNVNALAEHVIEAFPRFRTEHRESIARIAADTRWFHDALATVPYLEPFPTHANAVFCRVQGSGRRLAEILYDEHGFVVKDGVNQGTLTTTASYVRMGIRNRDDNGKLLAALRAIDPHRLITSPSPLPVASDRAQPAAAIASIPRTGG